MPARRIANLIPLFLGLLLPLAASSAQAQMPAVPSADEQAVSEAIAIDEPTSKAAVRELVSRLNDDAVRTLLIQRLDAVAVASAGGDGDIGAFGAIGAGFEEYWLHVTRALTNYLTLPRIVSNGFNGIVAGVAPGTLGSLLLYTAMVMGVGFVAERAVAFLLRKRRQRTIDETSRTLGGVLRLLYTRLGIDVFGVLVFVAVSSRLVSLRYAADTLAGAVAHGLVITFATAGLVYVVCRFFFSPDNPKIRICRTGDERARAITWTFTAAATFIVFMHKLFYVLVLVGIFSPENYATSAPLGFTMNISLYLAAAAAIWSSRHTLTEVLAENHNRLSQAIGGEAREEPGWFAENWPFLAVLAIFAKYLLVEIVVNSADVAVYSETAVYLTFVVIFMWPAVDANISMLVGFSVRAKPGETEAGSKARCDMQLGLQRVGRVLVVGLVIFLLAKLWGADLTGIAETGLGAQAAGTLVEMLFVGLFAYLTWELVSIFVGYWLAQEVGTDSGQEEGGGEIGGVGLSRTATLLPIIEKTAKFIVVLVSFIVVLDKFGVNVGPILAGAGVVGLAIGFGAQTLVKDIVSGLFFLADDAFRVGEYIDVGGTMGNVEKISIRSLRLRHHRGLVHTIPYGEIPKLTNYSRDWVIMKLRFKVPFDTDINKVKKIFKQIGNEMLEHPELGGDFLQPFKSQGVAEVDDNGIVVRGKFMAKPGKQFMIRKEVYVRVQKAFDEAGIPFARKQVMVHIPGLDGPKGLAPEAARQIGGAASEAVEADEPGDAALEPKPAT